jgi:hypothetical protein
VSEAAERNVNWNAVMGLSQNIEWKSARALPLISSQILSKPFDKQVVIRIAIDQFQNKPELGTHFVSRRKVQIANDNRLVFFGRTVMGLYTISWVVHHFLERPLIIDVSTQFNSNIQPSEIFFKKRMPKMMPFIVN